MSIAKGFVPNLGYVPILSDAQAAALVAIVEAGFNTDELPNKDQVFWIQTPCDLRDQAAAKVGHDWRIVAQRFSFLSYRVVLSGLPDICDAIQPRLVKNLTPANIYLEVIVTTQKTYRLFARYQTIIGSKLLAELSQAQWDGLVARGAEAIQAKIDAGTMPSFSLPSGTVVSPGPTGTKVAFKPSVPAVPLDLQGEMALLQADGQRLMLPKTQLKFYADIKAKLTKAGGKYSSKGWFEFLPGIDPAAVLAALLGGDTVNGKKDSQSFFTPPDLAADVCAEIAPKPGMRVLEPSGGGGALADPVRAAGADVVVVENYPVNVNLLKDKGYAVVEQDFLSVTPEALGLFDAIVANPPFSRNQDIDHVLHMLKFLKPGGTLSVITSQSWMNGTQKKQLAFRELLAANQARIEEIPAGAFKSSGTDVATARITLKKAA